MYICVCNGLTDKHVDRAIAGGAKSASAVQRCFGAKAQCGTCASTIRARIKAGPAPAALDDDYGCAAAE